MQCFTICMSVATILVMLPRCRDQTFVPSTNRDSTQNLALIGQAVSEKKKFESVDGRDGTGDGRTPEHGFTNVKLFWRAFGSGELINIHISFKQ